MARSSVIWFAHIVDRLPVVPRGANSPFVPLVIMTDDQKLVQLYSALLPFFNLLAGCEWGQLSTILDQLIRRSPEARAALKHKQKCYVVLWREDDTKMHAYYTVW